MQSAQSSTYPAAADPGHALLPAHGPSTRFHRHGTRLDRPGTRRSFPLGAVLLAVFLAQFAILWLGVMFFRAF